ncbi:hypothetical protein ACQ4LE_002405 [Meloidogyne hapla]
MSFLVVKGKDVENYYFYKNYEINEFAKLPLSRLPKFDKSLDITSEILNEEKRSSENSISNNPLIVQLMSGLPTKKFGGVKTKNDVLRNVLLLFNSGQKPKSSTYRLIRISEEQNRQGMANNISNSNKNIAIPLLRQLWT